MNATLPCQDEWIDAVEAGRILKIDPSAVRRMIRLNLVTVRHLPGAHPQVNRAEMEVLANTCIKPPVQPIG